MLFNSLQFLLLFLPVTLAGFYLLLQFGKRDWIYAWLVGASLIFYAVWNPPYVALLVLSMVGNHALAKQIERLRPGRPSAATAMLYLGVAVNVGLLVYYKYANFFLDISNAVAGTEWTLQKIILPLAISFYTLQQVAFLVDVARGEVKTTSLARYATFVIFFPQLIAGPIVHYREMMPQFFGRAAGRFASANIMVGLVIFGIGLFKKTVIADTAAGFSSPIFTAARIGAEIDLVDGWTAVLCYTIQLYFDFSGYSDMAIGLARMFGIILPMNFHSPLRAGSIIDYWRRWHMTLQRFIVAYIFQPIVLPLARRAAQWGLGKWQGFALATVLPTMLSFIISGLWHGAAWTFVLWGMMHGVYVAVNEFWRQYRRKARRKAPPGRGDVVLYYVITLLAVLFANVMFRAEGVDAALAVWGGMLQLDQLATLGEFVPVSLAEVFSKPLVLILIGTALIAFFPNTQQLMERYRPVLEWDVWRRVAPPVISLTWRPTLPWAVATGLVLMLGTVFILRGQSEFIYFNF